LKAKELYERFETKWILNRPWYVRFSILIITILVSLFTILTDGWVKLKYLFVDPEYDILVHWYSGGPYPENGGGIIQILNQSSISLPAMRLGLNYKNQSSNYEPREVNSSWIIKSIPPHDISEPLSFVVYPQKVGLDSLFFMVRPVSGDTNESKTIIREFLVNPPNQ